MSLPRFTPSATLRPIDIARGPELTSAAAPALAVEAEAGEWGDLALVSGSDRVVARYDGRQAWLEVTTGGRTRKHRSRRSSWVAAPADRLALTLTGPRAAVMSRESGTWVVRAVADLADRIDVHDERWLAGVGAEGGPLRAFGQLGLRDLRPVTHADGTPYREGRGILLTATSAGPGFCRTAHTSVWALDDGLPRLRHLSDLFFRRPDRPGVYGDHASQLIRDDGRWLVATSTWGHLNPGSPDARIGVTLAESGADLLTGRHVLDTAPLDLPTTGLASVGVWDPHLVRTDDGWLAGYVNARKFFEFHPVLATGPSLDALELRAALPRHRQTEGPTLLSTDEGWRMLVSDGENHRYPMLDLDLTEVGELAAPYPSNIPWPTLVPSDAGLLHVSFDGEQAGGRVPGYGTHGAVHLARPT